MNFEDVPWRAREFFANEAHGGVLICTPKDHAFPIPACMAGVVFDHLIPPGWRLATSAREFDENIRRNIPGIRVHV